MLAPGTVVADRYRLVRVLGRGGMGIVVEATHVQLGTSFALKFLYKSVIANASMAERFLREARATAALKSEYVCRVFDVGKFDGLPYLVMERLDGTDLAKILRTETRISPSRACDYLIQACAGIVEAHAAQIIHRDLKPGNLFLTARADGSPLIKVLDFGVAKAPPDDDHELTGTNTILGSPSYMSPEQLRSSKQVDTRSDIWSLGVILFELVSGRKPFVGDGVAEMAVKIATAPAPRLVDGPPALEAVIARCLARDPGQRYQQVRELAYALAYFAGEPGRRLASSLTHVTTAMGIAPIVSAPKRLATAPAFPPVVSPPAPLASSPATPPDPAPPPTALTTSPLSALTTAPFDVLATLPVPRSDGPSISGMFELNLRPLPAYEPATTMQSAGEIENPAAPRGPRARVGVIVLSAATVLGISLAIMASWEEGPRAPEPVQLKFSETADVPPPVKLPSLPPPEQTFVIPTTAPADAAAPDAAASPDAAVPDSDELAIEFEPELASKQPSSPAPASKWKPQPKPKPSLDDLSKSRI